MAFDATIVSERADQPGSCATTDGCNFFDAAIAAGIDAARSPGAKVINLSLGGSTPGPSLLAAMQRAVNAGIVIVISAGNDSTPEPRSFALDPGAEIPGIGDHRRSLGGTGTNVSPISRTRPAPAPILT